nr:reverse transcriptase domain-containing protein [Tanacetum cinerariifolium]
MLHGATKFLNKFHSDGSLAMLIVDFSNAFNLVDRTTLLHEDYCQLLFHAWYLDDGTIVGDTKEVAKAIDIIRAEGPRLGLELNIKKIEVFWSSCNGVNVKDGLFPCDIGRLTLAVKLLGD